MIEVSKTDYAIKDIDVSISEITDGIYRISGFANIFGITFNQFLINDEKPMLIHTGPIGMYKKIEEKIKEVIPLTKLIIINYKTVLEIHELYKVRYLLYLQWPWQINFEEFLLYSILYDNIEFIKNFVILYVVPICQIFRE